MIVDTMAFDAKSVRSIDSNGDKTHLSYISCIERQILYHCTPRETHLSVKQG